MPKKDFVAVPVGNSDENKKKKKKKEILLFLRPHPDYEKHQHDSRDISMLVRTFSYVNSLFC